MKNMTLDQALTKLYGQRIKLGSGCSFFYCDKVNNQTRTELKDVEQRYLRVYKARYNAFCKRIKKDNLTEKQIKRYQQTINCLKKKMDTFKPFVNRKVKEIYDAVSYDEKDAKIVRIVGNEVGDFWTLKEYNEYKERKYGKKKVN